MKESKVLLLISDGVADRADRSRRFQTPLSVAKKPHIDKLASMSSVGLMYLVEPGVTPGSDVAHLALLGYDPYKYYTGRGALEAIGAGFKMGPSDVAFRSNFSTVDSSKIVQDRRAGRSEMGLDELAEALNEVKLTSVEGIESEFHRTLGHRGVLILKGENLSRMVTDTDPHFEKTRVGVAKSEDDQKSSKKTAAAVNEFTDKSYEALKSHPINLERVKHGFPPANIVLSRGAGTPPPIERLDKKYSLRTTCIAAAPIVRGICDLAGMKIVDVPGATGRPDTNYLAKADATIDAMKASDFVLLHIKAADVAGHDGDFKGKVKVVENLDRVVGRLLKSIDVKRDYFVFTADHATPVAVREHASDPVPLLCAGPDFDRSMITKFSERSASHGNLGTIHGRNLFPILMDRLWRLPKFGF